MADPREVLEGNWKNLLKYPNVLNTGIGTKIIGGIDTKIPCITIYVKKKVHEKLLATTDLLPKKLESIPIDVVELNTEDWVLGDTEVSQRPPATQRRIAGGVRK
jgi:hypothetical protein